MSTTIRTLQPGDEAMLEHFLLQHMESSMFLLGNMRAVGLQDTGVPYSGSYAAVIDNDQIVGVIAHYWNGNLMCQAPNHALQLYPVAVAASDRKIHGVVGPYAQVSTIGSALDLQPEQVQMNAYEGLFSLELRDLRVPAELQNGTLIGRRMHADDLEQVVAWRVAYNIEALGSEENADLRVSSRTAVERSFSEGRTWVLEAKGKLVATSSFNTAIREAVQVGGVWTPPALRGRGYARAAVATSLLDACAEGIEQAILFTGDTNHAAQKAYQALGFQRVGDYGLLLFKEGLG